MQNGIKFYRWVNVQYENKANIDERCALAHIWMIRVSDWLIAWFIDLIWTLICGHLTQEARENNDTSIDEFANIERRIVNTANALCQLFATQDNDLLRTQIQQNLRNSIREANDDEGIPIAKGWPVVVAVAAVVTWVVMALSVAVVGWGGVVNHQTSSHVYYLMFNVSQATKSSYLSARWKLRPFHWRLRRHLHLRRHMHHRLQWHRHRRPCLQRYLCHVRQCR